ALFHAAIGCDRRLEIDWVNSGELEKGKGWDIISRAHGIVVPGGFGYRGVEGKILAGRYARENKVPYLGLCLGMQTMCIEFARNVLGLEDANRDRKSTRLNSSHVKISYAVFCLKKKKLQLSQA